MSKNYRVCDQHWSWGERGRNDTFRTDRAVALAINPEDADEPQLTPQDCQPVTVPDYERMNFQGIHADRKHQPGEMQFSEW